MFRSDSPVSSQAGSTLSTGYSTMDDVSQASLISKPSAKSIYMKRMEYAASLNQMMKTDKYKVEHLFSCELDGVKLRNTSDCVERLEALDRMGKVWGQDMMLEVSGVNLLLTDFETKEELESIALGAIVNITAALDSSRFRSLLTVSAKAAGRNRTSVYIFQCENVGADHIQMELSHALSRWSKDEEPELAFFKEDYDEERRSVALSTPSLPPPYTELDRNVDIMNRILNDIEIFMGSVAAAVAKNTKRRKKTKKAMNGLPPASDFISCFQKIKCGFNLLVELNEKIDNPSAPDFVHYLFSILEYITQYCPRHLPSTVVAPLLTPQCVHLMHEEVTAAEERRWKALGDAWTVPSTQWPKDQPIPAFSLTFIGGWQPRPVDAESRLNSSLSSSRTTPAPPSQTTRSGSKSGRMRATYNFISRNHRELTVSKGEVVELLNVSRLWWKVRNVRGQEGFVPSNILEPEDKAQMEVGSAQNFPLNTDLTVAESSRQVTGPVTLSRVSTPAEVKAWLEQKGFTKITIRCLGVLNGSSLLAMTREELKSLCPEEGGRVFFQLQAVRCALAINE
ncbi:epidermal growth factor receptor kinase substrate 8-like protein 3 [Neosynchiropus ocellatus]